MNERPAAADRVEAMPSVAGYRLLRVLGHGGMSTVYLAEQQSLSREVALKVMLPAALADEVSRRRFENEARIIARLEHPHIVSIFEVGRTGDGQPWYAMPHLSRGHLGQRDLRAEVPRVRDTLRALLDALAYAHARGVIHRDVKADNVLFDEAERPLLADFGIALRKGFGPRMTTAGLAVGSTAYMAPEQARGEDVDPRADLYSVGVLAWEMLNGQLPYNAGDALSMAVMHAQDPIPRLPPPLRHWQRFMDKALAKAPNQRFESAAAMREAIERIAEPDGTPGFSLRTRLRGMVDSIRRWPRGAWVGLVLLAAAAGGVGLRSERAPDDGGNEATLSGRTVVAGGAGTDGSAAAASAASGVPMPAGAAGAALDPTDGMLRAAPESAAEPWIADAERQLRRARLTAPPGDNALDSLVAAWRADPAHVRLAAVVAEALEALQAQAVQRVKAGDYPRATAYVARAESFAAQTGQSGSAALAALRPALLLAASARVDQQRKALDRDAAVAAARFAATLGAPGPTSTALMARAQSTPRAGDRIPADPSGAVLVRVGDRLLAAMPDGVSRGDFGRFVAATGHAPTLCRERASLLRIVKPRTWQSPGFEQTAAQPVVCISHGDGLAYVGWRNARDALRWRLPTAAEASALGSTGGARALSIWTSECAGNCSKAMVAGSSWRGVHGTRSLDGTRGYDDVGLRLVRTP